MVRFQYGAKDGFWRTLMTPFEGTVWAPEFSEEGFAKIQLSMNKDEVLQLIGEPIRKICGDNSCFGCIPGKIQVLLILTSVGWFLIKMNASSKFGKAFLSIKFIIAWLTCLVVVAPEQHINLSFPTFIK